MIQSVNQNTFIQHHMPQVHM